MAPSPGAARDAIGIYGKIPAQGDFVRINASDPAAQSLDLWVQESLDALQRAGAEIPPEPVYFFHQGTAPQGPSLVGVMHRSRDRVGRVYPVVVFARVDPAVLAASVALVPTAWSLFLQDAARLAYDLERADAALLAARARSLRIPSPNDLQSALQVGSQVLQRTPMGEVLQRLFVDASAGRHYYAVKTCLDACDATRSRPPRAPIVLDCPIASDVDQFAWIELCRRRLLGTPVLPTFVWVEGAAPRLLLSLGAATGAVLRFLARPEDASTQRWPLLTTRPDAIELARSGLAPHHRQAVEAGGAPLDAVLSALAR